MDTDSLGLNGNNNSEKTKSKHSTTSRGGALPPKNWWSPIHPTSHQKSSFKTSWKSILTLALMIHIGITWLLSGLILNFASLILHLFVRPWSPSLYRRLNYAPIYGFWSQMVGIVEYLGGAKLRVFFADKESKKLFGKEQSLIIGNHSFETDWVFKLMVMDKYNILANEKAIVKSVLKYFPVMGWSWFFAECVFLERNADKDKSILQAGIDTFLDYPYPTITLLFCEGTRPTPSKYATGVQFAESKGIVPYRHHLVPRAKGLQYILGRNLERKKNGRTSYPSIFNVQVAFREESKEPTFYSILLGQPILGDVYVERIPLEKWDTSSPESISKELFQLYRQKDDLMDYHKENNRFPGIAEEDSRLKPRMWPLLNLVLFPGIATVALFYTLFFTNWVGVAIVTSIMCLALASFIFLIGQTRAKRGSSYGSAATVKKDK